MKTLSNRSRIAFAAALLLVAASAVARQDGGPHGDRSGHRGPPDAEMRVAKMTQMLDLTDEQSARLLVVMQDVDLERDALHDRIMEQMKPELCDLQLRTESEINTILTPEQLALLQEQKESRPERARDRGRRGMDRLDCSEFE
jgi:Spy/CpxP family protein refolding chaperone